MKLQTSMPLTLLVSTCVVCAVVSCESDNAPPNERVSKGVHATDSVAKPLELNAALADSVIWFLLRSESAEEMRKYTTGSVGRTRVVCIRRREYETADSTIYLQLGYDDELRFAVLYSFEYSVRMKELFYIDMEKVKRVAYLDWLESRSRR